MNKMLTRSVSVASLLKVLPKLILCGAVVGSPVISNAAINMIVPNGDFSDVNNVGAEAPVAGVLGSYDKEFGDGPWSVDANGIDILNGLTLAAPSANIDQTNVTIGGLVADLNVLEVLSTSASVYQNDIGATFNEGWEYTLTADVSTVETLTVDLLSTAGVGIGLRSTEAGEAQTIYADGSDILLGLGALVGNTSTITYTFTASSEQDGKAIGVDLYVGQGGGLADVSLFGAISFDNVTLTAVPEPGTSALLIGILSLTFAAFKRAKRVR